MSFDFSEKEDLLKFLGVAAFFLAVFYFKNKSKNILGLLILVLLLIGMIFLLAYLNVSLDFYSVPSYLKEFIQ